MIFLNIFYDLNKIGVLLMLFLFENYSDPLITVGDSGLKKSNKDSKKINLKKSCILFILYYIILYRVFIQTEI